MSIRDLTLQKFSDAEIVFDPRRAYLQREERSPYLKPVGFWVSVAGEWDWPGWCESEEFNMQGLAVRHDVQLSPSAQILLLSSVEEIDDFTTRYGWSKGKSFAQPGLPAHHWVESGIDWHRVAADYDGIIITPYQWERRLERHTSWYYGWDCASGCIWNPNAIASVKPDAWRMLEVEQ